MGTSMKTFRFGRSSTSPFSFCSAATRLHVPTSSPLPYAILESATVMPSCCFAGAHRRSRPPAVYKKVLLLLVFLLAARRAAAHGLQALEGVRHLAARLRLDLHGLDVAFQLPGHQAFQGRL